MLRILFLLQLICERAARNKRQGSRGRTLGATQPTVVIGVPRMNQDIKLPLTQRQCTHQGYQSPT